MDCSIVLEWPKNKKRTKMKSRESLYPDVDRNRPIRKKVNDWYSEKQQIVIASLERLAEKNYY